MGGQWRRNPRNRHIFLPYSLAEDVFAKAHVIASSPPRRSKYSRVTTLLAPSQKPPRSRARRSWRLLCIPISSPSALHWRCIRGAHAIRDSRIVAKVRRDHRAAVPVELGVPLHEEQQISGRPRVTGHEQRDFQLRARRIRVDPDDRIALPQSASSCPSVAPRCRRGARRPRRLRSSNGQRLTEGGLELPPAAVASIEQRKYQGDLQSNGPFRRIIPRLTLFRSAALWAAARCPSGTIAFFPTKTAPCAFPLSMFRR